MKLHLGCGKRYLKGHTHIDLAAFSHLDYIHDIKTLPMIDNESVELIYAAHVLGYFDRVEVLDVLKEWFTKLKKGGILRLATPDFNALIALYDRYHDLNLILGPLFGRWPIGDTVIFHKTVYNFVSLKNVLESIGFSNVKLWNWREVFVGKLKGYDDYSQAYYPHMDKENGVLLSLNIEAIK